MHGMNIKKIAKCVTIFNGHDINSECQNYVYIHNKWRHVRGMHVHKCTSVCGSHNSSENKEAWNLV